PPRETEANEGWPDGPLVPRDRPVAVIILQGAQFRVVPLQAEQRLLFQLSLAQVSQDPRQPGLRGGFLQQLLLQWWRDLQQRAPGVRQRGGITRQRQRRRGAAR